MCVRGLNKNLALLMCHAPVALCQLSSCVHWPTAGHVTADDPHGQGFQSALALRAVSSCSVLRSLDSSYVCWLENFRIVLARTVRQGSAGNTLAVLKEKQICFLDGRPLNLTLLQGINMALDLFNADVRQVFLALERTHGRQLLSFQTEKLRRLMHGCNQMATALLPASRIMTFILEALSFHLHIGLKRAGQVTNMCMRVARKGTWGNTMCVCLQILILAERLIASSPDADLQAELSQVLVLFKQPMRMQSFFCGKLLTAGRQTSLQDSGEKGEALNTDTDTSSPELRTTKIEKCLLHLLNNSGLVQPGNGRFAEVKHQFAQLLMLCLGGALSQDLAHFDDTMLGSLFTAAELPAAAQGLRLSILCDKFLTSVSSASDGAKGSSTGSPEKNMCFHADACRDLVSEDSSVTKEGSRRWSVKH